MKFKFQNIINQFRRITEPALFAAFAAFLFLGALSLPAQAQISYVTSDYEEPWDSNDNITGMNGAFGSGNWSESYFETTNPASLFSASSKFVFIDGSDRNANAMNTFLTDNIATIENWVSQGGSLFLNAAPNQGGDINFGFGVTLNYDGATTLSLTGTAAAPNDPIFNGPFGATGDVFTASYFSHATVTGNGLMPLITGTDGTSLGEENYGMGHVYFGGMTEEHFHSPQPQSTELFENLLYEGGQLGDVPEPSTWMLLRWGILVGVGVVQCVRATQYTVLPRV